MEPFSQARLDLRFTGVGIAAPKILPHHAHTSLEKRERGTESSGSEL
jgi:hypothetical protein